MGSIEEYKKAAAQLREISTKSDMDRIMLHQSIRFLEGRADYLEKIEMKNKLKKS